MNRTLREIIRHLREEAEKKFADEENAGFLAVGGLLFLRFISPALVSPTVNQLYVGTLTPNSQRTLTLISKIMQQLANDIDFGVKEPFMEPANVFLKKNRGMDQGQIHKFFHDLAACLECDDQEPQSPSVIVEKELAKRRKLAEERMLWGLHNIHKVCIELCRADTWSTRVTKIVNHRRIQQHFHKNMDKLRVLFMQLESMEGQELKRQSYISITDLSTLSERFMALGDIMDELGPPPQLSLQHRAKISKANS